MRTATRSTVLAVSLVCAIALGACDRFDVEADGGMRLVFKVTNGSAEHVAEQIENRVPIGDRRRVRVEQVAEDGVRVSIARPPAGWPRSPLDELAKAVPHLTSNVELRLAMTASVDMSRATQGVEWLAAAETMGWLEHERLEFSESGPIIPFSDDLLIRKNAGKLEILVESAEGRTVDIDPAVIDQARTRLSTDALGKPALYVGVLPSASTRIGQMTSVSVGQTLAVIIDGEVVAAPRLAASISSAFLVGFGLDEFAITRVRAALCHPLNAELDLIETEIVAPSD